MTDKKIAILINMILDTVVLSFFVPLSLYIEFVEYYSGLTRIGFTLELIVVFIIILALADVVRNIYLINKLKNNDAK